MNSVIRICYFSLGVKLSQQNVQFNVDTIILKCTQIRTILSQVFEAQEKRNNADSWMVSNQYCKIAL